MSTSVQNTDGQPMVTPVFHLLLESPRAGGRRQVAVRRPVSPALAAVARVAVTCIRLI